MTRPAPDSGTFGHAALAEELEHALHDVLRAWFPRCVDERYGGFLTDLDYKWRPRGRQDKGIEFQGRMTGLAAHASLAYPAVTLYRDMADHGFRFLQQTMWDGEYGGWYRVVDREGRPGEQGTKHTHGSAYALGACATHHRATSSSECLDLAKRAFEWLDRFARDEEHGGYYGPLQRDGRWIRSALENPVGVSHRDVIGTPFGYKDVNTNSDMMRGLSELLVAWPDDTVRGRLRESCTLVSERFVAPNGGVHIYVTLDWQPIPDFARFAQALHTANHLRAAAHALGESAEPRAGAVIKSIVDLVLAYGWDARNGGFYFGGSTFGPAYIAEREMFLRDKVWWGQAEGLRALVAMTLAYPGDERRYEEKLLALWRYIQRHMIDTRRGGWLAAGTDGAPDARKGPKASMWRDSSHEGMALLESVAALRA